MVKYYGEGALSCSPGLSTPNIGLERSPGRAPSLSMSLPLIIRFPATVVPKRFPAAKKFLQTSRCALNTKSLLG